MTDFEKNSSSEEFTYSQPDADGTSSWSIGNDIYLVDASGRVTHRKNKVYHYGAQGRITSVEENGVTLANFIYDEAGLPLIKLKDGNIIEYYLNPGKVNSSILTETSLYQPVEVNGRVVGVLENEEFIPIKADFRNSYVEDPTTGIINIASPYGERFTRSATLSKLIDFASKGYDEDLDLVRMGHRYMDSGAKRFITPDPLFMESPQKCVESPFECNLYSYAGGNPAMFLDPSGLELILEVIGTNDKGDYINERVSYNSIKSFSKDVDNRISKMSSKMQKLYKSIKTIKQINNGYTNELLNRLNKDPQKTVIDIVVDKNFTNKYNGLYKDNKIHISGDIKTNIDSDIKFASVMLHELAHAFTKLILRDENYITGWGNELRSIKFENIILNFFKQPSTTIARLGGYKLNISKNLSGNPKMIPETRLYQKNPVKIRAPYSDFNKNMDDARLRMLGVIE